MKAKGNFYKDNPDIEFHLKRRTPMKEIYSWLPADIKEGLGIESGEEYSNMWLDILNTMGEYSGSTLASNAPEVEKQDLELKGNEVIFPPAISENIDTYKEIGGCALTTGYKYGGLNAPMMVELISDELISRACPSTMLNICWFGSIGNIIEKYGTEEQKQEWCTAIAEGRASGSMSLTEPDVGSDLANVRSYGNKQDDGSWELYGNKQFISNGCGEISLVLAKNGKTTKGLKSLCLFLVPRKIEGKHNFNIVKVEEKPGLHGSATCALEFDGSKAWLIGKEGEGFLYMLDLMNEARIAVGFQGLGLMEACIRLSKDFADQRIAFDKPISEHELIAEKILDMDVETKAFRSLLYQAAYYASLVTTGEAYLKTEKLSDKERAETEKKIANYNKRLREWTPAIKWWSGEKGWVHARTALQIHGGYGFTTEYKPEWWVRESLILSIYEGTSQIQGLMTIKDTMKDIIRRPREFIEIALGTRWKAMAESNPLKKKIHQMRQIVNSSLVTILFRIVKANANSEYDTKSSSDIMAMIKFLTGNMTKMDKLSPALLHAERICEMKAIIAQSRCALWDAEIDSSRQWIAERFINKYYPVVLQRQKEIELDDPILNEILAAYQKK